MRKKTKLVCGVGVNDADYPVRPAINGEGVECPIYVSWKNMLRRCYGEKYKLRRPTYEGCSVYEGWLIFSKFKAWMETQDWKGKELDKDLLFAGNKVYSADTCVFVSSVVNGFLTDRGSCRGELPIGVNWHKRAGKCVAQCRNPFTKKKDHLGLFNCPGMAHKAWKKRKHELACQLADIQTDDRVAAALRVRYLPA